MQKQGRSRDFEMLGYLMVRTRDQRRRNTILEFGSQGRKE